LEGIPLPTNTLSFEARVDRTLQELRQEIAELRQHLRLEKKPEVLSLNPVSREVAQYIEQKQGQLAAAYSRKQIITDTDDLGKLRLILATLQPLYGFRLDYLRLGRRRLPEHVVIQRQQKGADHVESKKAAVAFLHTDAYTFAPRIKNFNQLVIEHKDIRFALFRDEREPEIQSKVSKGEIEKLNSSENGRFVLMDRPKRIHFELVHQIISDIQNHDLHAEPDQVMPLLVDMIGKEFWLFRAIGAEALYSDRMKI
jgi:hypothetical protein